MSNHYEALSAERPYHEVFGVAPPEDPQKRHVRPRASGYFIRAVDAANLSFELLGSQAQAPEVNSPSLVSAPGAALPGRELVAAQWGLVPHWVKSASDGRLRAARLVNAKSETVSSTRAFRDAWLQGQRCIVPMAAYFEDDWRSGKAFSTRISRSDGQPLGVAGVWASWTGPEGETVLSYTLLTMNANNHALLRHYQQPGSEKRMPVILNEGAYGAWLTVRVEKAKEFMRQYPAQALVAHPVGIQVTNPAAASGTDLQAVSTGVTPNE